MQIGNCCPKLYNRSSDDVSDNFFLNPWKVVNWFLYLSAPDILIHPARRIDYKGALVFLNIDKRAHASVSSIKACVSNIIGGHYILNTLNKSSIKRWTSIYCCGINWSFICIYLFKLCAKYANNNLERKWQEREPA